MMTQVTIDLANTGNKLFALFLFLSYFIDSNTSLMVRCAIISLKYTVRLSLATF